MNVNLIFDNNINLGLNCLKSTEPRRGNSWLFTSKSEVDPGTYFIEVCLDKFDTYWYIFLLSEVSSETVFLKKVFNSSQMFLLVCSNSFLSTSFCLFVSFCYSRKKVWTFLQKILLYFTKERFKPLEKVFPFFLIRASTSFFCFL